MFCGNKSNAQEAEDEEYKGTAYFPLSSFEALKHTLRKDAWGHHHELKELREKIKKNLV